MSSVNDLKYSLVGKVSEFKSQAKIVNQALQKNKKGYFDTGVSMQEEEGSQLDKRLGHIWR